MNILFNCRGHPLVGVIGLYTQKYIGICICYRPTIWGFSHCLIAVGRQRAEAHASICILSLSAYLSRGDMLNDNVLHIHGHLPLLYPWLLIEFCENSRESRISADKRFISMFDIPLHNPQTFRQIQRESTILAWVVLRSAPLSYKFFRNCISMEWKIFSWLRLFFWQSKPPSFDTPIRHPLGGAKHFAPHALESPMTA